MQSIMNMDITKLVGTGERACAKCGKPYENHKSNPNSNGIWIPTCGCAEEKARAREDFQNRVEKRILLKKRYIDADFPLIMRGERLCKLTCEHLSDAKEFVRTFRPKRQKGFHFVGTVGNGKSTSAVCIGKEIVLKGYKVKFMTFSEAVRLLQSTYGIKNKLNFKEQMQELAKYDLLILDDFGREAYKDRTLTDVFDFLNFLYNEKVNVILTSNPEMIEKVKQIPDFMAMLDRFHKMAKYRLFENPSYRREAA